MSHLLNETLESNSLKYLAHRVLKIPKEEIKEYDEVTPGTEEFYRYGLNDAVWTFQLYEKYRPEIIKQRLSHLLWDIEMPFQKVLMELKINGIKPDISAAKQMAYEIQHLYYEIENELLEIFGGEYVVDITPRGRKVYCEPSINFNSSIQVVPLIEGLGFEIYELSDKSKKKSWAKRAKMRLAGKHPAIDLLIKLGKVEKLLNGFLIPFERYIDEDNKIRCSFHNTVAVTGRLSCSSPNIEQLPKNNTIANIRNLFISSPGSVFIVADYAGQELRILGEESKDKNLCTELHAGVDLHQAAADAMGFTGPGARDKAKPVSFGIPYGKEAYGFSRDWNCSIEEAQERIDKYFKKYPSIRTRIEKCRQQVYQHGFVRNMSGRKRRFPGFKRTHKWAKARCYRQAFNFLIQSMGADVVKVASANIIKDIKLKIVNIVHDEVVVECPKYYVEQGIEWIRKCMEEAIPISIPWVIDFGTGERYGEAK
jgi:DNA polymerase-1